MFMWTTVYSSTSFLCARWEGLGLRNPKSRVARSSQRAVATHRLFVCPCSQQPKEVVCNEVALTESELCDKGHFSPKFSRMGEPGSLSLAWSAWSSFWKHAAEQWNQSKIQLILQALPQKIEDPVFFKEIVRTPKWAFGSSVQALSFWILAIKVESSAKFGVRFGDQFAQHWFFPQAQIGTSNVHQFGLNRWGSEMYSTCLPRWHIFDIYICHVNAGPSRTLAASDEKFQSARNQQRCEQTLLAKMWSILIHDLDSCCSQAWDLSTIFFDIFQHLLTGQAKANYFTFVQAMCHLSSCVSSVSEGLLLEPLWWTDAMGLASRAPMALFADVFFEV